MLYEHDLKCEKCGTLFDGSGDDRICSSCYEKEEIDKRKKYMIDIRDGKSLEQRIKQIEDWIYENKDLMHGYHATSNLY